jgi:hypothetical protein
VPSVEHTAKCVNEGQETWTVIQPTTADTASHQTRKKRIRGIERERETQLHRTHSNPPWMYTTLVSCDIGRGDGWEKRRSIRLVVRKRETRYGPNDGGLS